MGLEPNNRSILQEDFSGSIPNERSVNDPSHIYISRGNIYLKMKFTRLISTSSNVLSFLADSGKGPNG